MHFARSFGWDFSAVRCSDRGSRRQCSQHGHEIDRPRQGDDAPVGEDTLPSPDEFLRGRGGYA